ncbi:MAG: diguanylate cyclase [Pseudomonadota bacterium]
MPNARPQRILVIDDNPEIIRVLTHLLSDCAEISFATDGNRGLVLASQLKPDLILLDMELPDTNGLALFYLFKADPMLSDIPVLFVTGGDSTELEVTVLEAGAVDYLTKPLRPLVVRARVSTQLALRKQTELLREMVNRDGLTGVFNRRYFDMALEQEVARQRRTGGYLSVAMVDVDHFKNYNDSLGHQQGDTCLRTIAQALQAAMRRPGEILTRYGGEEFSVVAPNVGLPDAAQLGIWIQDKINKLALPHPASTTSEIVTVSIGIATGIPTAEHNAERFIAVADRALYTAKQAGRNRHVMIQV